MARYRHGGRPGDFTVADPGTTANVVTIAPSATGTVWSAETGGVQYTDLQTLVGAPTTGITSDGRGNVVGFFGPDEVRGVWADFGSGRVWLDPIGPTPPATATAVGGVQLSGDLGGTAAAVTVPGKEGGVAAIIHVSAAGNDANSGLTASGAKKTLAAALTAMGTATRGIIRMGAGVIDAGAGVSLSGYRCVLQGMGEATVVQATAPQTGPVVDLSGWLYPNNAQTSVEFRDFQIIGDGTAGATKKGLRASGVAGTTFRNITVSGTGGTPFDYSGSMLCTFENLVASQPVSANANNIPYHYAAGATNGNLFNRLGLRSITTNPESAGGCILFESDAYAPLFNLFLAPWFEYLHLPTNGSLFKLAGSQNHIQDPQFFDSSKVTGATGTTCLRLSPPTVENTGANIVTGYLPGSQGGTSIDTGITVEQSGNLIDAIRGYGTAIVTLAAGVDRTHATLRGAESTPSGVSFVDNSGTVTNLLIEAFAGKFRLTAGNLELGPNALPITTSGYTIALGAATTIAPSLGVGGAGVDGQIAVNVTPSLATRRGLVVQPYSTAQSADLAQYLNGSGVVTAVLPFGTLIADDATKGIILKDAAATPNYWRVTVSTTGVLTTTNLGTARPTS